MIHNLEFWQRRNDEKYLRFIEIESDTLEQAKAEIHRRFRWVFRINESK